jgi:hypothetical protein
MITFTPTVHTHHTEVCYVVTSRLCGEKKLLPLLGIDLGVRDRRQSADWVVLVHALCGLRVMNLSSEVVILGLTASLTRKAKIGFQLRAGTYTTGMLVVVLRNMVRSCCVTEPRMSKHRVITLRVQFVFRRSGQLIWLPDWPQTQGVKSYSRLGGVVVSVLATGPKYRRFKPGRGNGFLRAIKISSTPSFGGEVKPQIPYRKSLRHFKDPLRCLRYWIGKIFFPSSIPLTFLRCLCWYDCQRALVDESGVIPSRHHRHHSCPRSHHPGDEQ